MYERIYKKECCFLIYLQKHRTSFMDTVFKAITHSCDFGIIWITAAVLMILSKKYTRTGIAAIFSLTASLIFCNTVLKILFKRIRPYDKHQSIKRIITQKKDSSFPSGHSSASFAASLVFLLSPEISLFLGISSVIFAALIAFSRLYVGVHYPSDVIAGSLLGSILAFITSYFIL